MKSVIAENLFSSVARIGVGPEDAAEVRLQKSLLVLSTLMMSTLAILWGWVYFHFDEPVAAAIPWGYTVLSYTGVAIFAFHQRYRVFRFSQLMLSLLLPFFLMLALGGIVNSSAVILWSLTSPLGAMLFSDRRQAIFCFAAYIGLVLLGVVLTPFMRSVNNLPPIVVTLLFVMNISGTSLVAFVLLQYFVGQKETALKLLRKEQAQSERLLLNVLPEEIAAVLKNKVRTIAERFEAVSILFADVVDFTPLSAQLTPMELLCLLDEAFSYFDTLVEKHGLEKIGTIGDSYMVAAGAPRRRPDHAQILARLALEMNTFAAGNNSSLQFRIGINSGPVVAGVIGTSKFRYDLWGVAVNTASRMESQGLPGKIQITTATRDLIKDEFICRRRGSIDVKGMGEMETWFVEGRRTARDPRKRPRGKGSHPRIDPRIPATLLN